MRHTRHRALVVAAVLVMAPSVAGASRADGVHDLPPISDAQLRAAVHDLRLEVEDLDLEVDDVARTTSEGAETVVTLRSDILFAFGKADLPTSAQRRVVQLVAGVPRGALLKVHGHTDSVGTDAANLALSRARAQAVASAVRAARPDLRLEVRGLGEAQPVEANTRGGKDHPEGRALNRRVELRHGG